MVIARTVRNPVETVQFRARFAARFASQLPGARLNQKRPIDADSLGDAPGSAW